MAIVNRDHDSSEQRDWMCWTAGAPPVGAGGATFGSGYVATAQTLILFGPMPYPYILQSMNAISNGTSGAPQIVPCIGRAVTGGFTVIGVGISNLVIANTASFLAGSTGSLNYSGLAATGSTLLQGQRGDLIMCSTAVANTASTQLMVNCVVKRIQDVVTMNGS